MKLRFRTDTHTWYTDVWCEGRRYRVWGFNSHKRAITWISRAGQ